MSKLADMAMAIQELHDAAAAIDDVANWLTRQFSSPDPKEPEPAPTLEQVRAVLAEKSRAGHTRAKHAFLLPCRLCHSVQLHSGHLIIVS